MGHALSDQSRIIALEQEVAQLREENSYLRLERENGALRAQVVRLRIMGRELLPGYEQYLDWAQERGVMFLKDARAMLKRAKDLFGEDEDGN